MIMLLACAGRNLIECIDKINNVLSKTFDYFQVNKLKLNIIKTKSMIKSTNFEINRINSHYNHNLYFDGKMVEVVSVIKYLKYCQSEMCFWSAIR